jgi:hypothetical protein
MKYWLIGGALLGALVCRIGADYALGVIVGAYGIKLFERYYEG